MFKIIIRLALLSVLVAFCASSANAQSYVYGNSACGTGSPQCRIDVIDATTGAIARSCAQTKGNGRGVVVVGTTAYYTVANSGDVFQMNIETCEDQGVAFTTATSGIATIAYDGANFWINQYDSNPPGNAAYQYSPTGTLLKTITLSQCTNFCDGVEYFEGKLISNRGDAAAPIYDVYDLDGNLLTQGFINDGQGGSTTGIAYDGTDFWVSDIFNNRLRVYDGQTGAFIKFVDITGGSTVIEDLSVDYAERPDTGGPPPVRGEFVPVPTLSTWALVLLTLSMVTLGWVILNRRD